MAKHPASLCYTTSPCCIWKSWPVKRLLSGGKYQWLCGIVNLFFQEKARTNWWSNQPMLAICHFCWLALSHILNYPVSIQLQPRTCPGISCGRQFIHSFIRAVFYLWVFCELPLTVKTCSRMGPWVSVQWQALKPRVFLLNLVSPRWEEFAGTETECRSAIQQCVGA